MLNIISHQGNANENHNELLLHTHYVGYKKKRKKILERMWRNYNLCTLLVGIQNGIAALEDGLVFS